MRGINQPMICCRRHYRRFQTCLIQPPVLMLSKLLTSGSKHLRCSWTFKIQVSSFLLGLIPGWQLQDRQLTGPSQQQTLSNNLAVDGADDRILPMADSLHLERRLDTGLADNIL
ncbi:hypothetical protein ATANTOWER_005376 [Ataeniobius toweri]|uniref:Uncharacterized protein n=1 Tax=Ataeniobius toweri TaxID=208326 RepID=A0ABU7AW63_9TELE|nr:hypothetical protein [Ataeniobius toweri]